MSRHNSRSASNFDYGDECYSETDTLVIDKILKKRNRKTKVLNSIVSEVEYLVSWVDYDETNNSWHTINELYDLGVDIPTQKIKNYEKTAKLNKKPKKPKTNKAELWEQATNRLEEMSKIEKEKIKLKVEQEQSDYIASMRLAEEEQEQFMEAQRLLEEERLRRIAEEKEAKHKDYYFYSESESDNDSDNWEWEEFESILEEEMINIIPKNTKMPITHHDEKKVDLSTLTPQEKIREISKLDIKKQVYKCDADPDKLREAIVCVLGHVDAGKTTLLDTLRNTNVQSGEAGGITQQIGATHIPIDHIKTMTEELNQTFKFDLKLPGFVCIDTPGHESFSNMRVRGSSLCDVAIVVVDIKRGLQSQTIESLKLLIRGKTRFLVALNKIDRLNGWTVYPKQSFRQTIKYQKDEAVAHYKKLLNKTREQLLNNGIFAVPYWRVKDLDVQVPIVPVSAIDGCGVPDLLLFTMLYSQCLLTKRLTKKDKMQCNVIEIQEATGIGNAMDVLLINGEISRGDKIILCSTNGPVVTQIRSIVLNPSLQEMKGLADKSGADNQVKTATAVRGLRIWAKNVENVIAGSSLYVIGPKDDPTVLEKLVMHQLDTLRKKVAISTSGVHVQASTLGSLEALLEFLNENGVAIGSFGIGSVNVKDVKRAHTGKGRHSSMENTLLAFDVKINRQAQTYADETGVDIIHSNVIYQLLDQFTTKKKKYLAGLRANAVQPPCILSIVPAYIVSEHHPLILGVEVLIGSMNIGVRLYLEDGTYVGEIDNIREVSSGAAVNNGTEGLLYVVQISPYGSVGSRNLVYGRDFFESDRMYTKISLRQMNELEQMPEYESMRKLLSKYRAMNGFPARRENV